ncbi:hypothetical protein GF1_06080 [Desulfolithobacter dissulfuricans]|uniref:Diguanylate cyclase n=1 Tax=Desulfolithobacter dissulfuricans TaxID=2795293 RepID=A0A915XJ24_9BACT|nr:diguanylate cyclase [Desulfolithobacter dissulfuricans]BCO08232.1 hypothetical protein GF1_06080 [Desulfolithobacter dissulfuricans]
MKKQFFISILIFIGIQAITVIGLYQFMEQEQNNLFHERQKDHEQQYKATVLTYRRLAEFAFNRDFNLPEVLTIVARARSAEPREQNRLRNELYNRLLPVYNHLRTAGFRQVHFHFADGTSFLRMHLPKEFGDQLTTIRPSVARVIQSGQPVEGYEMGRHWHAYRFIFPLFAGNHFIGSVEISAPLYALLANLMDAFPSQTRFVVRRQMAEQHLNREALEKHYRPSALGENFLEERTGEQNTVFPSNDSGNGERIDTATIDKINGQLRGRHNEWLQNLNRPFSLPLRKNGTTILTTLLPIDDISGQTAGYLVLHERCPYYDTLQHRYTLGWFIITVFSLLLLLMHSRYAYTQSGRIAFQKQLIDSIPTPVVVRNTDNTIVEANNSFTTLLATDRHSLLRPDQPLRDRLEMFFQANRPGEQPRKSGHFFEQQFYDGNGTCRDLVVHETPFIVHNREAGWINAIFDVTDLKKMQRELEESHAELDQIFNTAADGIRVIDKNGITVRANSTFAEMVGLPVEEIIGQPCHVVFPGSTCTTGQCTMEQIKKGRKIVREEAEKKRPDGKVLTCLTVARPFVNPKGQFMGIIEDFRDISERKHLEQQLQTLSVTDELTGLNNRRGFMTLAAQQLQCIKRSGNEAFLLFADLDNMKRINDTLGHEAGDRALQTTARILQATVRKSDVVARMGGDEFAILLGTNPAEASEEVILRRLNEELARVNKERPQEEQIAISFGIVRAEPGTTLDKLLNLADKKMYAVKKQRKAGGTST